MNDISTYRPDIDGLRGVAVLAVVIFHSIPDYLPGGFIGVDVFFVISGYLITGLVLKDIESNTFSLRSFYQRRVRRIAPALLLCIVGTVILGWQILMPSEMERLGRHIAAAAVFASNFVLWSESGYFDAAANTKYLLHLWSLAIEEQFYLLWPLLLLALSRRPSIVFPVVIGITITSYAICGLLTVVDPVAAFYSPLTRAWELLAGALLTVAERAGHTHRLKGSWTSGAGLVAVSVGLVAFNEHQPFPGWQAALPVIGAVLIISGGPKARIGGLLAARPLRYTGLISYPLYLWHWPLLVYANIMPGDAPSGAVRCVALAAAVLLAWGTYQLVEKPTRLGIQRWIPAALVAGAVAVGVMGVGIYRSGGLPERLPPIVREIVAFNYDFADSYRANTCFLNPQQNYASFEDCGLTRDKTRPTILLWGDSYAAHLYPGYREMFGSRYNLIQRTASACPPMLGRDAPDRPFCRHINDEVLRLVRAERPDRVVLSTAWFLVDWRQIAGTINVLKEIGIDNIDLVGPVPFWNEGLPRQLYLHYLRNRTVPNRMKDGLGSTFETLDPEMAAFALGEGVNYLSPYRALCSSEGCITRSALGDIVAWDTGHLTAEGSKLLVAKFPEMLGLPTNSPVTGINAPKLTNR